MVFIAALRSEYMSKKFRKASHSVFSLHVHLVWITKYRYSVLTQDIGTRVRDIIRQECASLDVQIISGVVSRDHVHLFVSYPPKLSVSELVKRLKGRSSRKIQQEITELRRKYWGRHFWGIGFGAFSSGNVTDEMIEEYIAHHDEHPNHLDDFKVRPSD